jgi:hypothetical protein
MSPALGGKGLCSSLAHSIRLDRNLNRVHDLSDAELEQLNADVLTHLGRWINGKERDVQPCTTSVGSFCSSHAVPQLESCYYLYLIREGVTEFLHNQDFDHSGDLESRANRFFDKLVCEVLRA